MSEKVWILFLSSGGR